MAKKPVISFARTLRGRAARTTPKHRRQIIVALTVAAIFVLLGRQTVRCTPASNTNGVHGPLAHAAPKYVVVFSTGRCGTQHFSRAISARDVYVTHEEEHARLRARDIVAKVYRPMSNLGSEAEFNRSAADYIRGVKLPFWEWLISTHGASRMIYTGHIPTAYGMVPHLYTNTNNKMKIVRLRRCRIESAKSLMALGIAAEDPWGSTPKRWFPTPQAPYTRLEVGAEEWRALNRFQKWLWYVDDVECRWQALKRTLAREEYLEVSLEELAAFDGGHSWDRVALFMGVNLVRNQASLRHNSIQSKQREKIRSDEATLRRWDTEYKNSVGSCRLDSSTSYKW